MGSPLENSIKRAESHIALAEEMFKKCSKRRRKKHSYYRIVLSFFFSRAWEMHKSLILLVKGNRVIDAAILVRSLCNMAIDLAYITKDSKQKELESIKYCIVGDKAQIKITEASKGDFRDINRDIDSRIAKLKQNVKNSKKYLALIYPNETLDYPQRISTRAEKVGGYILKIYNMVYRGYSNIEHHNMLFGQNYVNIAKSEPILNPEKLEKSDLYRPEFLLYLFEWILLMILFLFNSEYRLSFRQEVLERIKIHKKAQKELMSIKRES